MASIWSCCTCAAVSFVSLGLSDLAGEGNPFPRTTGVEVAPHGARCAARWNRRPRLHADGGFESTEFIQGVLAQGLDIVVGVRCTRKLEDGRQVRDLMVRGSLVKPQGLDQTMCVSWVWLYRNNAL